MRKNLAVLLFMAIWAFLMSTALLWGLRYDWPDNVHVNYGLPLTWATNTLSTLVGPTNLWDVNVSNLLADFLFWWLIAIAVVMLILYKLKESPA